MDTIAQTFLADIERYLASRNIEASAFGKQALGDPNFVFDLKKGRSPSTRTMDKVRAFMAAANQPKAATTAPGTTPVAGALAWRHPPILLVHPQRRLRPRSLPRPSASATLSAWKRNRSTSSAKWPLNAKSR